MSGKPKKALKVKTSLAFGRCFIYSDYAEMVCPFCKVTVPIRTEHNCQQVDLGDRDRRKHV